MYIDCWWNYIYSLAFLLIYGEFEFSASQARLKSRDRRGLACCQNNSSTRAAKRQKNCSFVYQKQDRVLNEDEISIINRN